MQLFLKALLPRLFPRLDFLCLQHEGKSDLEQSIPRKLRAWNEQDARFIIVRDNDIADCRHLKQQLRQLCIAGRRPDTLIRIPCQELEAWYLGDFAALAQAYNQPRLAGLAKKAKYRDPDAVPKPAVELERLIPGFQKQAAARKLGALLAAERNCSRSFQVFLAGIRRVAGEMRQELK